MKTAASAIAPALADRRKYNATLKTFQNPGAKFESHTKDDHERRRVRAAVKKHRSTKRPTGAAKLSASKKARAAKRCSKKARDAETITKASRHIPCNSCGRRKAKCGCFTKGRGLEITQGFKRKLFQPIPQRVEKSRIQTWRDTGDMPAYMQQIGWKTTMRYRWLFPAAFTWRHFSNKHLWEALQKNGAVLQNQLPEFAVMENLMRAFKTDKVPYHCGTFYSASSLRKYRWCNDCFGRNPLHVTPHPFALRPHRDDHRIIPR